MLWEMTWRLTTTLILFVLCSCATSETQNNLNRIEDYIRQDPKRAYVELSYIKPSELGNARERGLYSLLLSMALDKNYIDIASDSLISPAVTYFSRHGNRQHKYLTWYYQGRVYENAGQYDNALSAFVKAETVINHSILPEDIVRLYVAKERVYIHQFARDKALEEMLKAREVSAHIDNPQYYLTNSTDIALQQIVLGNYDKASGELDSLASWMDKRNIVYPPLYYEAKLRLLLLDNSEQQQRLDSLYNIYSNACSTTNTTTNAFLIAEYFSQKGEWNNAKNAIMSIDSGQDLSGFNRASFLALCSRISQGQGDYQKALDYRLQYENVIGDINLTVFNNDVRFLEERYKTKIEKQRSFFIGLLAALLLLGATIAFLSVVRRSSKRKANYEAEIKSLKKEYFYIKTLVNEGRSDDKDTNDALQSRLTALRPYLGDEDYAPYVLGRKDIARLESGRKDFLKSIGLLYALSYPGFVSELVHFKLTAEEIGLCALYAMGYESDDVSKDLDSGSIYHMNSSIRLKLKSVIGRRLLPSWLKELFKKTTV